LNVNRFLSMVDAEDKIEQWRGGDSKYSVKIDRQTNGERTVCVFKAAHPHSRFLPLKASQAFILLLQKSVGHPTFFGVWGTFYCGVWGEKRIGAVFCLVLG
jgi:hypothetical protein